MEGSSLIPGFSNLEPLVSAAVAVAVDRSSTVGSPQLIAAFAESDPVVSCFFSCFSLASYHVRAHLPFGSSAFPSASPVFLSLVAEFLNKSPIQVFSKCLSDSELEVFLISLDLDLVLVRRIVGVLAEINEVCELSDSLVEFVCYSGGSCHFTESALNNLSLFTDPPTVTFGMSTLVDFFDGQFTFACV